MVKISMPAHAATQMGADIRKDSHLIFVLSQDIQSVVHARPLSTIDSCAGEIKTGWASDGIVFERPGFN
jgi:hypothetical protein